MHLEDRRGRHLARAELYGQPPQVAVVGVAHRRVGRGAAWCVRVLIVRVVSHDCVRILIARRKLRVLRRRRQEQGQRDARRHPPHVVGVVRLRVPDAGGHPARVRRRVAVAFHLPSGATESERPRAARRGGAGGGRRRRGRRAAHDLAGVQRRRSRGVERRGVPSDVVPPDARGSAVGARRLRARSGARDRESDRRRAPAPVCARWRARSARTMGGGELCSCSGGGYMCRGRQEP